jgi:hypothetical protein
MLFLQRRSWLDLDYDLTRLGAYLHDGWALVEEVFFDGSLAGWRLRDKRDEKCPHCGLTVYPQPYHERDDPACKVPA